MSFSFFFPEKEERSVTFLQGDKTHFFGIESLKMSFFSSKILPTLLWKCMPMTMNHQPQIFSVFHIDIEIVQSHLCAK